MILFFKGISGCPIRIKANSNARLRLNKVRPIRLLIEIIPWCNLPIRKAKFLKTYVSQKMQVKEHLLGVFDWIQLQRSALSASFRLISIIQRRFHSNTSQSLLLQKISKNVPSQDSRNAGARPHVRWKSFHWRGGSEHCNCGQLSSTTISRSRHIHILHCSRRLHIRPPWQSAQK